MARLTRLGWLLVAGLAAYGLAVLIILYSPLALWLLRPLYVPADLRKSDAIVVLAAWASVHGELNESGLNRALHAGRLYRRGLAEVVVVSGGAPDPGSGDSAKLMAELLTETGVPTPAIILEYQSHSTHDSAVNVARLVQANRWSQILLVSDAKHMKRALAAFRRQGVVAAPAPTMVSEVFAENPSHRFLQVQGAVHEHLGLLYYWWRGWI